MFSRGGGKNLSAEITDELLATAYAMAYSHERRKGFKTQTHEGLVTTEFQRQQLVTISGIVFSAQLESDDGSSTIDFIMRDSDLAGMAEDDEIVSFTSDDLRDELENGNELDEVPKHWLRPSPLKRFKRARGNN